MSLRIALAQINPTVGDIQGNLELIRQTLSRIGTDAQLVVFPEGSLPGYPAQDLLLEKTFLADLQDALEALAGEITDQWVIVGTVRRGGGSSSARRKLYNTAAVLHQGKIVTYRDKTLLPTYDVFDEDRYFTPAERIKPVTLTLSIGDELRVGLHICEDLWDHGYGTNV